MDILILSFYSFNNIGFLFLVLITWIFISSFDISWLGLFLLFDSYTFILLVLITIFIFGIILIREINYNLLVLRQVLIFIRVIFFFSNNLIILYIFFELSMFPIIIIILGYGSQIEKINSFYYLLFYASFCSFPFLFLYFQYDLRFTLVYLDKVLSWELFFLLSLGFIIKFPVYFLHLWLPKAHVEAPTTARILLAGLLLKLGTAGFLRIIGSFIFIHENFWLMLSFLGMLLGSFCCIFQRDSKSLAAYSSVTHIGFLLICLVYISLQGKISSLILILAHGYTSTLIFYFIGEFYHSSNTRIIYYFNSLFSVILIFGIFVSLVFLSNAGVPPSMSFISEFISISFIYNKSQVIFVSILLYFFFAFYYSIYFITNSIMGKHFYVFSLWFNFYSIFFIIIMFNFFWLNIFF